MILMIFGAYYFTTEYLTQLGKSSGFEREFLSWIISGSVDRTDWAFSSNEESGKDIMKNKSHNLDRISDTI